MMQNYSKDTFSNVNSRNKEQHETSYSYQYLFYSKVFRLFTLVFGMFLTTLVLTDMNGGKYSNSFFTKSNLIVEAFEISDKINSDVYDQTPEQGSSLKPFLNDFNLYCDENNKVYKSVGEKILSFSTYVRSRIIFHKHKSQNSFFTLGMDTSTFDDFKLCEGGSFGNDTKTSTLSSKREKFRSELLTLKLESTETELSRIDVLLNKFEDFVSSFSKMYKSLSEKAEKFEIFAYNCIKISNHNAKKLSFKMGINEFADLTSEEFKDLMLMTRLPSLSYAERKRFLLSTMKAAENDDSASSGYNWFAHDMAVEDTLPDYVDWIQKGCVSKIKNQGKCGSCWAFSASGAVEGAYCAKHHILPNLSEQQLVDCAQAEGNRGCNGGNVDRAFLYMIKEKGLCTEDEYPYKGTGEHCHAKKCEAQVTIKKFIDVPRNDVKSVMSALVYHSPVSVGVDANEWQFYKDGIFDEPCGTNLNHEVLIVGYGTAEQDSDYWTIKNSWGESWGQKGYMQIRKNVKKKSGKCGILEVPVFPVVY